MVQESHESINLFNNHKHPQDIIDINHPLVKLADSIDWESIEEELSQAYPSTTGHPNKPIRLMASLHYLRLCLICHHIQESIQEDTFLVVFCSV